MLPRCPKGAGGAPGTGRRELPGRPFRSQHQRRTWRGSSPRCTGSIPRTGRPPTAPNPWPRGTPRPAAIAAVRGAADPDAAEAAWDEALRAPDPDGPPVWIHADLQPGNMLLAGRGSAVR
ncbi:phosphotransferase [Streptomyces sp. NPDC006706]